MASQEDDSSSGTTTSSVYIQPARVEALNRAATKVSYETESSKQFSPSWLARFVLDNYLDVAVQKLISELKKK